MSDSDTHQFGGPGTHLEMWKHYDNLRQEKFSGFLTANSILLAIAGLLFTKSLAFIAAISFLGVVVYTSWFLLLTRNTAYIKYHRERALKDYDDLWEPKTCTPPSKYLDRMPAVAFTICWVAVLGWSVIHIIAPLIKP